MKPDQQRLAEGILFTDQYQLTMAQLFFRMGMHDTNVQFDHFYRKNPDYGEHQAGFCINAGLDWLLNWMRTARFRDEDIECLRAQKGRTGERVFQDDFLDWLRKEGNFEGLSMMAIPEGRVVHPNVPLTVVCGPLAKVQILESALLNMLNYQTLIATKAARIRAAGRGQTLLEFGMRRGHDRGVNAGIRAALIGGADFTSATGVSCALGLPPKGTHAHSMVQAFMAVGEGELAAFRAYADVYPDDCLLLVDTIDTLRSGIPNAITVFQELRKKGHEPFGVRLDSGDLAHLAVQSAKMLDQARFPDVKIVLSNLLDEMALVQILNQIEEEAPGQGMSADRIIRRLVYGVGTRMITSRGDAALDGVFKLVAIERDGEWTPAIKLSETPAKTLNPGYKKIWRLYDKRDKATADLLAFHDEDPNVMEPLVLRHPVEYDTKRVIPKAELDEIEPLHVEVLREGRRVYQTPPLGDIRERRDADLERLDLGVKRFINPYTYHVSLSEKLMAEKQRLIRQFRMSG
ncbi:nicotinate phosphoribosyltransferase [bacterium]|nr:nicotinate phosphoribosyltransferase [bacterium]